MIPVLAKLVLIDRGDQIAAAKTVAAFVNLSPSTPDDTDKVVHRVTDSRKFSDMTNVCMEGYEEAASFVDTNIPSGVAVHCNAGYQRSIPFLAYYMQTRHGQPVADTVTACLGYESKAYEACVESVLNRVCC